MNFSGKKEIAERWSQNVRKSIVKSQRQRKSPRSENHEVVSTLASATVCTDFAGVAETRDVRREVEIVVDYETLCG